MGAHVYVLVSPPQKLKAVRKVVKKICEGGRKMDNTTINHVLKKHPLTKKYFKGVYSRNTLPKFENDKRRRKMFLVVNTDPSYKDGSHWIVLMLNTHGKKNIYFDSYGLPPQYYVFKKFLENNYTYSKKQVQHPLSTACGQWCIFFIWEKCKGKHLNRILKFFTKNDFLGNDHVMNLLVEKNFKTKEKIVDRPFLKKQIAREMSKNIAR